MNASKTSKEASYKLTPNLTLVLLVLTVIVTWGVVPAFAQTGGLAGDVTTFWVNVTATPAVAIFVWLFARNKVKQYSFKDYLLMAGIGVAWPLIYSIAYFSAVVKIGAALTSIINYTWPVWYLVIGWFLVREKISRYNKKLTALSVGLVVLSVAYVNLASGISATIAALPLLFLGLVAAVTQGFYSAANDRWDFDPWIMTLVVEIVTLVGVTPWVLLNHGSIVIPDLTTLGYLAFIGVFANGIGFWAFLASSKLSDTLAKERAWIKPFWLVSICFVPFGQILVAAIMGLSVPIQYWIGALIMVSALIAARFAQKNS